jgi:RNA recognition motif-containing protein
LLRFQIKRKNVKNIFVGNLSFQTTELDIRSLFESYGTVDRVNVVTDRDSGQAKGFGFVEMTNDGEGEAIAGLSGQELGGRALTVNEARPKSEGAAGGRGRGYSGGGGGGRGNSGGNGRGRY